MTRSREAHQWYIWMDYRYTLQKQNIPSICDFLIVWIISAISHLYKKVLLFHHFLILSAAQYPYDTMAEWSIARACKALKPSVQIRLVSPKRYIKSPYSSEWGDFVICIHAGHWTGMSRYRSRSCPTCSHRVSPASPHGWSCHSHHAQMWYR